jgi:hypothetical protein
MFRFLGARRRQRRTSLSRHGGDASGMRHQPGPADSARVEDHTSGDAAPGWIFVSMVETPADEVRYQYLARSTVFDVV